MSLRLFSPVNASIFRVPSGQNEPKVIGMKDIVKVLGEPDNRTYETSYVTNKTSKDTVLTTAMHYHRLGASFITRSKIRNKQGTLIEIQIYRPGRKSKEEIGDNWDIGSKNYEDECHQNSRE